VSDDHAGRPVDVDVDVDAVAGGDDAMGPEDTGAGDGVDGEQAARGATSKAALTPTNPRTRFRRGHLADRDGRDGSPDRLMT
jgi:hypothetical protein